jgi:hypothetical protein
MHLYSGGEDGAVCEWTEQNSSSNKGRMMDEDVDEDRVENGSSSSKQLAKKARHSKS